MAVRRKHRIEGEKLRPWIDYQDDLADSPNEAMVAAMNSVVHAAFTHTKAAVHQISGKLSASGYMNSSMSRTRNRRVFSAYISYGRGLKYAKYEFGRDENGWPPKAAHPYHPPHNVYTAMEPFENTFGGIIDRTGEF